MPLTQVKLNSHNISATKKNIIKKNSREKIKTVLLYEGFVWFQNLIFAEIIVIKALFWNNKKIQFSLLRGFELKGMRSA